jgi:hypothetical protein
MSGIGESTRNFHYQWLERTIERLEEHKQHGEQFFQMQTGELQHVFRELLSMHLRCDRLETMLSEFAGIYQRSAPPLIPKEELKHD